MSFYIGNAEIYVGHDQKDTIYTSMLTHKKSDKTTLKNTTYNENLYPEKLSLQFLVL